MSKYLYSTLTSDQSFIVFGNLDKANVIPSAKRVILVSGKANIMNKSNFVTPRGVVTVIEDADLELLKKLPSFNRFVDRGFIAVESKEAKSADDAAKNLTGKDKSAQKTPDDIKKSSVGSSKLSTNKNK